MKLWLVEQPQAVPPFVITSSEEQRDAWVADGTDAVYEIDAALIFTPPDPEPTPPASE